jgi:flagellum-specific peptidoglycan hydrolase FlgJ
MTGFAFAHGTVDEMTSPTRMPVHLLALDQPASAASSSAQSSSAQSSKESALRSAIVKVANYYLRMAQSKSPAEMEVIIWGKDSVDGVDHGQSCAAFASLTLALGAQATGQESWATGGTTYPWPLHQWADVRVDPNPASPEIISIVQDAQAHHRWHPVGDGYRPQPGDWVTFDGHVEVVTKYSAGALYTIGGDSSPNLSVNAHTFTGPLAAQGVTGFVDNGELLSAVSQAAGGRTAGGSASAGGAAQAETAGILAQGQANPAPPKAGGAAVPGTGTAAAHGRGTTARKGTARMVGTAGRAGSVGTQAMVAVPGMMADGATASHGAASRAGKGQRGGAAAIPGLRAAADDTSRGSSSPAAPSYTRNHPPAAHVPDTAAQQAFISEVAPGALAAQSRYGIPAAVTIAQAIDESGWGQSALAIRDHNLFGIKGTGPAGSDMLPTREYANGRWVTRTAPFRVYHNVAQSIADHGQLLATGASYQHAMADRHLPDAFATDLTGVYATDPQYGSNLIAIMRLYNLYRYSASAPAAPPTAAPSGSGSQGGAGRGGAAGQDVAAGHGGAADAGAATIPGVLDAYTTGPVRSAPAAPVKRAAQASRPAARVAPRQARTMARASRYVPQIPPAVTTAFISTAKAPLSRAEPLYDDVASRSGIRWELLAACDWMQCQAQPRYSPVYGEKLGTVNAGGTVYRTKSEALGQCASDLVELAMAVYWLDITARRPLSVRDLAKVFAAFRWGGLLKLRGISAMEFPYSVEGLTAQHVKMRWPDIKEPNAPDKPGTRFRLPFGAVPVVLCLGYPALA